VPSSLPEIPIFHPATPLLPSFLSTLLSLDLPRPLYPPPPASSLNGASLPTLFSIHPNPLSHLPPLRALKNSVGLLLCVGRHARLLNAKLSRRPPHPSSLHTRPITFLSPSPPEKKITTPSLSPTLCFYPFLNQLLCKSMPQLPTSLLLAPPAIHVSAPSNLSCFSILFFTAITSINANSGGLLMKKKLPLPLSHQRCAFTPF